MPGSERSAGNVSLSEMFGHKGADIAGRGEAPDLSIDDIKELLGDGMPKVSYTRAGKLRLVRALQQRFGDGFKNVPGLGGFLEEFEEEIKHKMKVAKITIARKEREGN